MTSLIFHPLPSISQHRIYHHMASPKNGGLEIVHECLGWVLLEEVLILNPIPRFKPEFHLFQVDEIILAHGESSANGVDFILLHIASLSQAEPHLGKGDYILALNLIYALALSFLLDHTHDLFDLMLAQSGEGFLLLELKRLDELNLLAEQQDHQADDLLIDALLDRDSAVSLQPHRRDVL